jgi:hypothetical protein
MAQQLRCGDRVCTIGEAMFLLSEPSPAQLVGEY